MEARKSEKKWYRLGHTVIEVCSPEKVPVPENMTRFETEKPDSGEIRRTYEIRVVTDLTGPERAFREACPEAREICRDRVRIRTAGDQECRLLNFYGNPVPFALSWEEPARTRIWVMEEVLPMLVYDTVYASLFHLEKLMLQDGALILHSAYMCREGRAVLFSAPSETGKSTQADLWEKYRGTRTVNGDRSLLLRDPDGWRAYGWPVCGSSGICQNESYPVEAIVMLYQAPVNEIRRLEGAQALQKIFGQVTVNMWDSAAQMRALDLLEPLLSEVPVFELGCTISEEAVRCLEEALLNIQ